MGTLAEEKLVIMSEMILHRINRTRCNFRNIQFIFIILANFHQF